MDELQNRLETISDWGYVIYRTTYTVESDTAFPRAIRYIEACLKSEFFDEVTPNLRPRDDDPVQIWSRYKSTIIEDRAQFAGASIKTVRNHFETWVDAQEARDSFNKFRMCIIIDEESLQTLKDGSVEDVENDDDELRMVKVLEAFPIVNSPDRFPGWMKCWAHALWFLWSNMGDGDEMRMLYNSIEIGDTIFDGVFCG
ncbi:hypothetical protein N7509_004909 [Penicillium cosmopolitanum]|uniref:Uncharacterized protein n=1 Tax=Penicillium cosmopolitanum TaxID=1131564 RepID=A0A9X0B9I4_9EURO|nr:uncharacterized protein N7509_004909 [Penicillium cosmopolitanum]KAJ5396796.1 hypothetical protein N7509_004909 [Penicillium cosmopolitanum]